MCCPACRFRFLCSVHADARAILQIAAVHACMPVAETDEFVVTAADVSCRGGPPPVNTLLGVPAHPEDPIYTHAMVQPHPWTGRRCLRFSIKALVCGHPSWSAVQLYSRAFYPACSELTLARCTGDCGCSRPPRRPEICVVGDARCDGGRQLLHAPVEGGRHHLLGPAQDVARARGLRR